MAMEEKESASYDTLYELGQVHQRELGNGKFLYTRIDEERKVNLNLVAKEVLERLPGFNPEIAEKVADSPLKPFQLKEQLLLIDGISEETFLQCKDFVTVHTEGKVNVNTAGHQVLIALGCEEDLSKLIEDFRNGVDRVPATQDDGIFENTDEILTKLSSFSGLSEQQQLLLAQLVNGGWLTVESKNFSLEIKTEWLDRPLFKYWVIVDKDRIKQWRE